LKENKTSRILIAGHEIGGQMQLLAEALRAKGYSATAVAFNQDFRQYSNDRSIPTKKIPFARLVFAVKAIFEYDVFHFFWGISLFDFWRFKGIDLPFLHLLKKKVIVHFRGTDLIDINYYDYLIARERKQEVKPISKSRPDQLKRLKQWRKYSNLILVSTPDLLEVVPEAKLVPQVVNLKEFNNVKQYSNEQDFVIGHAPTRRNTKGTDLIINAIDQLRSQGRTIRLDLIENESPNNVIQRLANCDICIDQLLSGWYGKVSVEAMALGKPVICFIEDDLKKYRPDLPVISASPKTLETELEKLIVSKELRNSIGEKSRAYALLYHDVERIANELLDFYGIDSGSRVRDSIEDAKMW